MVIFHSYVSLPEGMVGLPLLSGCTQVASSVAGSAAAGGSVAGKGSVPAGVFFG